MRRPGGEHAVLKELGRTPVRSDLVHLLVDLDRRYVRDQPAEPWESWYAGRLAEHFSE